MRAFDVAADRVAMRSSSDIVVLLRLDEWLREHYELGERPQPLDAGFLGGVLDAGSTAHVRTIKQQIRQASKDREPRFGTASTPGAPRGWWQDFENHPR
jgi:hypothetical protein